ncbi:hypothetical protein QT972_15810 [Microcoleus sp. herbarium7]|uniref:hypothetical protein n=1 Tax=Microcoleus sp. herbarium7 TaxID=3055435 RepID=UPI002FD23B22
MITENTIDSFHTFQFQSDLLLLHLQLAEGDDKPKRSGNFESTYKNAAGNEVTITRTPDGKFGSKGGSGSGTSSAAASTASTATKSGEQPEANKSGGSNTSQIAKDLLSGKLGDQLKESIGAGIADARIKAGVQRANFSEILGKGGDAIGNAEKYISEKFKECVKAVSESELCKYIGEILVASTIGTGVAFSIALATGAQITLGTILVASLIGNGIVDNQKRISERLKKIQPLASADAMKNSFDKVVAGGKEKTQRLLEDIKTVVRAKREAAKPSPKVDPKADSAAKAELAGASGASLKKSLIAGAAESPNIAAGIEATKMIDVVSGSKDFFSNAKQFMSDKIQEAATAGSERTADMAIGGAILGAWIGASMGGVFGATVVGSAGAVGALDAAYFAGKDVGEKVGKAVTDQVTKLLNSTDIDEKVKAKLESATPESVKKAITDAKLFMTDALIRKIVMERTKEAIVKAVKGLKAKVESGEAAESVLASVKDLPTRVKDLTDRMQVAGKQIQDTLSKQNASRLQDAPPSKDNEVTV